MTGQYLYQELESAKKFGAYKELPQFIRDNLNPSFELRPYQENALCNFITYFETPTMRTGKQIHTLFHMATGSGKTLVMAALMLYLFRQGYRNFLFFVNLSQIVRKTEDNFLNPASSKYLFAKKIKIDGREIRINKVSNFQDCNENEMNVLFDTTAALHSDLFAQKENAPTIDDFLSGKTVLIADEAHHLNASTKRGETGENDTSWESTISRIRTANEQNIMIEFTATCDLQNPLIQDKYEDKIIFDYPLKRFRADKYSKDIYTVRSDFPQDENGRFMRILQALILSQYRLKRFESIRQNAKPVVLLKSKTIKESQENRISFEQKLKELNAEKIEELKRVSAQSKLMAQAFAYFEENGVSLENIAEELKRDFCPERTIDVNNESELEKNQILVNSLEDADNPYRLIFEVEKLDEGWDCLNLFDIVRLYETRDSKGSKPGKSTVREAQLIGRGARYFPFVAKDGEEKYKRKFDFDIDEPLRICEQLHYHCQENSRYISELNNALKEVGIDDIDNQNKVCCENKLKEEFKRDELYKSGVVFLNKNENKTYKSVSDIAEIKGEYSASLFQGAIQTERLMDDGEIMAQHYELESDSGAAIHTMRTSFSKIAKEINYNLLRFNAERFSFFNFRNIKNMVPAVKSFKEFLSDTKWLGKTEIVITSSHTKQDEINAVEWNRVLKKVFAQIAEELSRKSMMQNGSKEFFPTPIKDVFKDTKRFYAKSQNNDEGEGVSQAQCGGNETDGNSLKMDLNDKDWYVYRDNFGTTEEKRFVKWFSTYVDKFKEKYSNVRLVRNELQASIYSFDDGKKFEPDFLLFLKNKKTCEYEYLQIFFEPKGGHLLQNDKWKEDLLMQLEKEAIPTVKFKSDPKYKVYGAHFFCHGIKDTEIKEDIEKILSV